MPSSLPSPPDSPLSPVLSAPPPPPLLLPPSTGGEPEDFVGPLQRSVDSSDMPSGVLLTTVVPETASQQRKSEGENDHFHHTSSKLAVDANIAAKGEELPSTIDTDVDNDVHVDADIGVVSSGMSEMTASRESSPLEGVCERCTIMENENEQLSRNVARLKMRLREAVEKAHTHGQRLLKAAYQEKIRELTDEHMRKTTEMLNKQKRCFEEELETLDGEAQLELSAMQRERDAERTERISAEERWKRERDTALEKTSATMGAVQRKLGQMHAKVTRLEREKKSLSKAVQEKQTMIEVLASAAAARDVERRRMEMMEKSWREERLRKDSLVEALQNEIAQLRERLGRERRGSEELRGRLEEREREWGGERDRYREEVEGCRREGRGEVERLGRLLGSVMQEYANASDVSTND